MYNQNNIFAKIIKGEIPCNKIYENQYALSFYDINPQAPIHFLVIPKNAYSDIIDFSINASANECKMYYQAIEESVSLLKITNGFRVISNCGINGGQEVPHFHSHILAGKILGKMISN